MNYTDITTIVETLKKRYIKLDEELNAHKEKAIQDIGGYDAYNEMTGSEKRNAVYNSEWRRILDERDSVYYALEHFKEYKF